MITSTNPTNLKLLKINQLDYQLLYLPIGPEIYLKSSAPPKYFFPLSQKMLEQIGFNSKGKDLLDLKTTCSSNFVTKTMLIFRVTSQ